MSSTHPAGLRIGALFVTDWTHEFADFRRGRVPAHRLFGLGALAERGHTIRPAGALPQRLRGRRWGWPLWQAVWSVATQHRIDIVLATHEAAALPVLAARRVGLLRRPVAVITVAAASTLFGSGRSGRIRRHLLAGADLLIALSSAQVETLHRLYPGCAVAFCPLGVDTDFFAPAGRPPPGHPAAAGPASLLAVGTNPGKDFPTLVRALGPGRPAVIVTDADNVAAARAAMSGQDITFRSHVPITELREMYAAAATMVFPLREVDFSSGQTVLLEALALGVPCVVSDVTHIRDYADPGVVHLVPAGDPDALRAALAAPPVGDPGRRRAFVTERFTAGHMADRLAELLGDLVPADRLRFQGGRPATARRLRIQRTQRRRPLHPP